MLTQKELLNLPELLNAHAAMMEKASFEQSTCQDPRLRDIIGRHAQVYRRHFDRLQGILNRSRGATVNQTAAPYHAPVDGQGAGSFTQGFQQFEPYRGPMDARRVSDRAVAIGCLEMNKHTALTATWMALEAANPEVRHALMDVARDHVEMAFEMFAYLQQHQWYAAPAAQPDQVRQVAQGFPASAGTMAPQGAFAGR